MASKCYESIYQERAGFADMKTELQFPLLFQFPGKQWVYLTEAAVDGTYAGARVKIIDAAQSLLGLTLADSPKSARPWTTPWRVLFVVDDLRQLVESTLINNLNPPATIDDTTWIQPGTGIFPWLTGTGGGGGPCHRNNNGSLERMKEFVDLASNMGWAWIEFDNALALETPYGGPPEKWMDTPWFPRLTAYAATRKIAVYGWDHMCNLDTPEKRKTQLDWYVAKGFKGIKVDFFDSDVQARYRLREELARDCAARHLLISYHGDITPRGMQRTWPNIATHEGVLGEEYYHGFGPSAPSPAYNVNLVFTRNVAGSMDYTPTTFDNPGKNGSRTTTNAHEIALAVVFESGWQAMGFNPESISLHAPACAFLKDLPSTWDDTRLVTGLPNEFAVVARRKGVDWWIAGIREGCQESALKRGNPRDEHPFDVHPHFNPHFPAPRSALRTLATAFTPKPIFQHSPPGRGRGTNIAETCAKRKFHRSQICSRLPRNLVAESAWIVINTRAHILTKKETSHVRSKQDSGSTVLHRGNRRPVRD